MTPDHVKKFQEKIGRTGLLLITLVFIVMTKELNPFRGDPFCKGEWCHPKENLLSELPKDPFRTIKICDDLTHSIKPGRVLSVNLSIACSPDYISYYRSVEGVLQILDGVFEPDDETLLDDLAHTKVMLTFATNPVRGFSIPLLTIRLDFFPDSDLCSLEAIENHLLTVTPTICGYLAETEMKHLSSIEEIRCFIYQRMTSEVSYQYSREFREMLTKTDMLRWDWFISSSPTIFYGENLINFRNHRVGHAMNVTDQHFEEIFSNWGAI